MRSADATPGRRSQEITPGCPREKLSYTSMIMSTPTARCTATPTIMPTARPTTTTTASTIRTRSPRLARPPHRGPSVLYRATQISLQTDQQLLAHVHPVEAPVRRLLTQLSFRAGAELLSIFKNMVDTCQQALYIILCCVNSASEGEHGRE